MRFRDQRGGDGVGLWVHMVGLGVEMGRFRDQRVEMGRFKGVHIGRFRGGDG